VCAGRMAQLSTRLSVARNPAPCRTDVSRRQRCSAQTDSPPCKIHTVCTQRISQGGASVKHRRTVHRGGGLPGAEAMGYTGATGVTQVPTHHPLPVIYTVCDTTHVSYREGVMCLSPRFERAHPSGSAISLCAWVCEEDDPERAPPLGDSSGRHRR
jgi:hypothetical protein